MVEKKQSKTNDWFLDETQQWSEMGYAGGGLFQNIQFVHFSGILSLP